MLLILPEVPSCFNSFWHGVIPTSFFFTLVMYYIIIITSIKIIKNEVGCRDDTVPKTVDTRRHCEEE